MTSLAFLSAAELAAKIRGGAISAIALTEYFIERIERFDKDINAVVVKTFESARSAARAANQAAASGSWLGPLHGVPMTIKESYALAGTPTTWGIEQFRDTVATKDSLIVQRFKQSGARFLGKTNVPVDLADFQSYNPIYGVTSNPWDISRTPGGPPVAARRLYQQAYRRSRLDLILEARFGTLHIFAAFMVINQPMVWCRCKAMNYWQGYQKETWPFAGLWLEAPRT